MIPLIDLLTDAGREQISQIPNKTTAQIIFTPRKLFFKIISGTHINILSAKT